MNQSLTLKLVYAYLDDGDDRSLADVIRGWSIASEDIGARSLGLWWTVVSSHGLVVQQLLCDIQADRLGQILQSAQQASFGVKGHTKVSVLDGELFASFGGGHHALWFLNINKIWK